jgi:hypothetical protein
MSTLDERPPAPPLSGDELRDVALATFKALIVDNPAAAFALYREEFEPLVKSADYAHLIVDDKHSMCDGCGEDIERVDGNEWEHTAKASPNPGMDRWGCADAIFGEDSAPILLDPYTFEPTTVRVIDVAERWTDEDEDGRGKDAIFVGYDRGADFEGFVYVSVASEKPVSLPAGWSENTY